jgi:hypothetical protein
MHGLGCAWHCGERVFCVATRQFEPQFRQLPCKHRTFLLQLGFGQRVLIALGAYLLPRGAQLFLQLIDGLGERPCA